MSGHRIEPLEPPYEPAVAAQLESMMPSGVPPIGLFRTFARNLPMTEAMGPWGGYELHDHADLREETASELASILDTEQLLDLFMLAGWYHAISYAANAAKVPLEDGAPRFIDVL